MSSTHYDTIIIGGGLAGLYAALNITRAGYSVCLIEARDRLGGRVHTDYTPDNKHFEYGATWVGPNQHEIMGIMADHGIETYPQRIQGANVQRLEGLDYEYVGMIPPLNLIGLIDLQLMMTRIEKIANKIPIDDPWLFERAKELDSMTMATFIDRDVAWTKVGRETIYCAIRSLFCVEPDEISALYCLWFIKSGDGLMSLIDVTGGAQQDRIVGGSVAVVDAIRDDILSISGNDIVLDHPVKEIHDEEGKVRIVTLNGDEYNGKYCICAVPPALTNTISFFPPLEPSQVALKSRMPMGTVIKTIVRYETPFWIEKDYSGMTVSDNGPICASYDYSYPEDNFYALLGFIPSSHCVEMREYTLEERKQLVCQQYQTLFKSDEALSPTEYYEKDWSTEIYTQGCYLSVLAPGVLSTYGKKIRSSHGKIHFAATELSTCFAGYMEGALQSGKHTASTILSHLHN